MLGMRIFRLNELAEWIICQLGIMDPTHSPGRAQMIPVVVRNLGWAAIHTRFTSDVHSVCTDVDMLYFVGSFEDMLVCRFGAHGQPSGSAGTARQVLDDLDQSPIAVVRIFGDGVVVLIHPDQAASSVVSILGCLRGGSQNLRS